MEILYEDNHLLVINKKPNWIVQGATADQNSLLDWGRAYLKAKYNKPGNVFLGVVSRLDAAVTGAVPFARTSKAASRLNEQIRDHSIDKRYWALVEGVPESNAGRLTHWLTRPESDTVTRVHRRAVAGGMLAELEYEVLWSEESSILRGQTNHGAADFVSKASKRDNRSARDSSAEKFISLLEIKLITGRKHQIRAQLQEIGVPILGDRKYGAATSFSEGIALHCRRLQFKHPTQDLQLDIVAPVPTYWPKSSAED